MKKIKEPLLGVDTVTIFEECANSFNNLTKITLLNYRDNVNTYSKKYDVDALKDIKNLRFKIIDADKIIFAKLYDEKFVKNISIRQKYYDKIMANNGGICPYCGTGRAASIDHYLPKNEYPLYCVEPKNLIPSCRDCNTVKRNKTSYRYCDLPFHPYYETVTDKWLECKVIFCDDICAFYFKNSYDKNCNPDIYKKLNSHFEIFKLNEKYISRAVEEFDDCKAEFKRLYDASVDELKDELKSRLNSYEANDLNSWKSAMYRGLLTCYTDFCDFLSNIK